MSKRYSVVTVGGGFSALVFACSLSEDLKRRTAVLERSPRVGKKLLATGNGRGNFTNEDLGLNAYHGDVRFAEYALKKFDNKVIEGFFAEMGVFSTVENGRVYPMSLQSNALLDALRFSLGGVTVLTDTMVEDISECGKGFTLSTSGGEIYAEAVVVCAGGKAAKNFGTDGNAYRLVEKFGHKTGRLSPSLVRLLADKSDIKGLKGVKEDALVRLFDGDEFVKEMRGDILFTDTGVSGNTVFYLSSYSIGLKRPVLKADFAPSVSQKDLAKGLKARRSLFKNESVEFLLGGIVHSTISRKIARSLFGDKKLSELNDEELFIAAGVVKNYIIRITGDCGFDNAQVTRGGILTKDVDPVTMESKLCPSLYFCGEILDVDGDCGGYNLQWAFSSAKCAAEALNERFRNR